jgi:hypothetical protein
MTLADSTFTADKINPEVPWEVRDFATSLAGAECKDDSAKFLALHAKGDLADLLVDCNDAVYMGCQRPTVLSTCPTACGKCLGVDAVCADNDRILEAISGEAGAKCAYYKSM